MSESDARGNAHADKLAKRGVKAHGHTANWLASTYAARQKRYRRFIINIQTALLKLLIAMAKAIGKFESMAHTTQTAPCVLASVEC